MYEDTHVPLTRVVKDMSDDYNSKLAYIMDEIDQLKQVLPFSIFMPGTTVPVAIRLNERLHSLYVKISPKAKTDERVSQEKLNKICKYYLSLSFKSIKKKMPEGEIMKTYKIFPEHYNKAKYILEKREININIIMERVGLTAKERQERRQLS